MKNMTSTIASYIRSFANIEVMTSEKTLEVFEAYKNGDENALSLLVNSNMKLVVKIASSFKDYDVDFGDLVSVGKAGLIKAIQNWDPDKSLLNSYAGWWIKKSMRELCDQLHVVHTKAFYRLTDDEKKTCIQGVSIDEKRDGDEDGLSVGDSIADDKDNPADEYEKNDLFKSAMTAIKTKLNQTEQFIVLNHLVNDGSQRMTLPQIAQHFGKTYQWAQQSEAKALDKIREYLAE